MCLETLRGIRITSLQGRPFFKSAELWGRSRAVFIMVSPGTLLDADDQAFGVEKRAGGLALVQVWDEEQRWVGRLSVLLSCFGYLRDGSEWWKFMLKRPFCLYFFLNFLFRFLY